MTEQIVIKLNKKKFKPLLDFLISYGKKISNTYSECVGKSLFFMYLYVTERCPQLNNQTKCEYFLNKTGTFESDLISFIGKYNNFLNSEEEISSK